MPGGIKPIADQFAEIAVRFTDPDPSIDMAEWGD